LRETEVTTLYMKLVDHISETILTKGTFAAKNLFQINAFLF